MNIEYFAEMHKLIEKAKTCERLGREEEALKIYLEIHERFFPNTSDLFERPAVLLEKRHHFEEAIEMCDKAIKLINEGKITGIKENFERRITRIKSRSDYTGPKEEAKKDKKLKSREKHKTDSNATKTPREPIHWPKFKWRKKTVALPQEPPVPKEFEMHETGIVKDVETEVNEHIVPEPAPVKKERFKRIKAYIKGFKNEHKRFRKPTKTELIALAILVTFFAGGIYLINNKPKSQFEIMIDLSELKRGPGVEGNPFGNKEKDLPPITKTMIDAAVKETQGMLGVKQAGIIVQKDVVGFVIITNPGASKAQAKSACDVFIKGLARAAASENPELSAPGLVGYGELFDYYTLLVVAGESYDNMILKGSKNPKALGIYWRNDDK